MSPHSVTCYPLILGLDYLAAIGICKVICKLSKRATSLTGASFFLFSLLPFSESIGPYYISLISNLRVCMDKEIHTPSQVLHMQQAQSS